MITIYNTNNLIDYLRKSSYSRINVIGSPGSGKTTLVKKLSKKLGYTSLNIDELFEYNNDIKSILDQIESALKNNDSLICDGTYTSLLSEKRINQTDVFVLLDRHPLICLIRIFFRNFKSQTTFKKEKISFKIIKVVLSFNYKYQRIIKEKIPSEKIISFYE